MDKFGRNYEFFAQRRDGQTQTIRLPFTIEFDIHRNSFSSANVASFRIYNLNPDSRAQLRKDSYDDQYNETRIIQLNAGYGDTLSLGYAGYLSQAWSVREGVNMVTQLESYDSGFMYLNAVTDASYRKETPNLNVVRDQIEVMKKFGIKEGVIGDVPNKLSKGISMSGKTTDVMKSVVGENGFFLDNNTVYVLNENECIRGDIAIIDADAGLLGTPTIENRIVSFDMIFEPRLKIGQVIELKSSTADASFNTLYKVIGLHHHGTISPNVSGTAITNVKLFSSSFLKVVP